MTADTAIKLDPDAVWRAVVDAAAGELASCSYTSLMTTLDRQSLAFAIAQAAVAKLAAAPVRRWTGTLDGSCWVCDRPHSEHQDDACPPVAP